MKTFLCVFVTFCAVALASAKNKPSPAPSTIAPAGSVSRTVKAMHYRPGASLKVALRATDLMPSAVGEAKIEARKSSIAVERIESASNVAPVGWRITCVETRTWISTMR